MIEFLSTNIGVAEICRKYGIPPTAFDNWRKRFVDAGRRELAGIGGSGGGDPAKAMARPNPPAERRDRPRPARLHIRQGPSTAPAVTPTAEKRTTPPAPAHIKTAPWPLTLGI